MAGGALIAFTFPSSNPCFGIRQKVQRRAREAQADFVGILYNPMQRHQEAECTISQAGGGEIGAGLVGLAGPDKVLAVMDFKGRGGAGEAEVKPALDEVAADQVDMAVGGHGA